MSAISAKILITGTVQLLVFCLVLILVLFITAGTLSWFYVWIFLILIYSFGIVLFMWELRHNPRLVEERTGFKSNQPTWDKAFTILGLIFFVGIWWISMPLDAIRFHWSQMPMWLHLVGVIVFLSSFYLTYLTYRENSYLSGVVRIQEDRGQTVISTGPYRYVRNALYTCALLFFLGSAFLLGRGSECSWGPSLRACLRGGRCGRNTWLQKDLKGYDAYMAQVRWRLISHVW